MLGSTRVDKGGEVGAGHCRTWPRELPQIYTARGGGRVKLAVVDDVVALLDPHMDGIGSANVRGDGW